jgi:acetate kinase
MKVLIINSGSSSIKFQLLDMADETVLASGLVERIGEPTSLVKCMMHPGRDGEVLLSRDGAIEDHQSGMLQAVDLLTDQQRGVVRSRGDIGAIGHRVVHGGRIFSSRR